MKQIIAFLCALFVLTSLQAQNIKPAEVPSLIRHQFNFLYPDATKESWQVKKENYQVDFKNDKKNTRALFMADGALLLTKTEIKVCALPKQALGFLKKDNPDTKIELASINEDGEGVITFNAVVDKTEFLFDWTGQYLISNALALNSED